MKKKKENKIKGNVKQMEQREKQFLIFDMLICYGTLCIILTIDY